MANLTKYIIPCCVGIVIGLLIYEKFLKPETETKIEYQEVFKSDTVHITVRDTIFISREKLKYVYLRDTVYKGIDLQIRQYKGFEPTLYGNIGYQSEVAGEMLNMNLFHDLRIPTITNTIEKTTTKTIVYQPSGIYATGGIDSEFNYKVGAVYLKNKALFGYEYNIPLKIHSAKVGIKVF